MRWAIFILFLLFPLAVAAEDARIEALSRQLEETRRALVSLQATVEAQERELQALRAGDQPEHHHIHHEAAFTPEVGVVAEAIASYESERPDSTGDARKAGSDFTVRTVELSAKASLTNSALGYVTISAHEHGDDEADLEVEEAAIVADLPVLGSSLRLGRFFGEFGRLATWHDHELPFVNRPLAVDEFVGGESKTEGGELRLGGEPFSLSLGAGTRFGEERNKVGASRDLGELNYFGRLSMASALGRAVDSEVGLSVLWNEDAEGRGALPEVSRRVGAIDFVFRYVPTFPSAFQKIEWGTEAFLSRGKFAILEEPPLTEFLLHADHDHGTGTEPFGDARRTVDSWGLYTYLGLAIRPQWSAGVLFDYAEAVESSTDGTLRYSPYVTFSPGDFQRWRLQYSYTDREAGLRDSHSIFLQWIFTLGFHSHVGHQH